MYMPRGRPAICPFCGGRSINKGFRKTKTMGRRRIKLCKACGRKFTPKNQKPVELAEEKTVETNAEPDEAAKVSGVAEPNVTDEASTEPVDNPKPLLNALGEEWT
jgi:hypothetical protein